MDGEANEVATYITNELGDVVEIERSGSRIVVNPSEWGWLNPGGKNDLVEERRSIDAVRVLPGFVVVETEWKRFEPGPRPKRSAPWESWGAGAAPPAAVRSRGGEDGTLAYFNRLSEAVGNVAHRLPVKPDRSPMHVYDFVGGRRFEIIYSPPPRSVAGRGTVYLLEDGAGIKIGYTSGPVAKRIGELQTGNPRKILTVADISDVTDTAESLLHAALQHWNIGGEWFDRGQLVIQGSRRRRVRTVAPLPPARRCLTHRCTSALPLRHRVEAHLLNDSNWRADRGRRGRSTPTARFVHEAFRRSPLGSATLPTRRPPERDPHESFT